MNKSKWIFKITFIVVLLVSSIGVYVSYPSNETMRSDRYNNQSYHNNIFNTLENISITLADTITIKNKETRFFDEAVKVNEENKSNFPDLNDEQWEQVKKETITELNLENDWWMERLNSETSLKYYAEDLNTGKKVSNADQIINYNYKDNIGKNKKYSFYIEVLYDDKGNMTYNTSLKNQVTPENFFNLEKHYRNEVNDMMYNKFYSVLPNEMISNHQNGIESNQTLDAIDNRINNVVILNNPTNMKMIYIVPNEISWGSVLLDNNSIPYEQYGVYILPYLLIALLIITLFILFYPIRIVKECNPFKSLIRIKGELLMLVSSFVPVICVASALSIIFVSVDGQIQLALKETNFIYGADELVSFINIAFWMIAFFILAFIVFWIKYIFHYGVINYFKDYTITNWLIRNIRKIINKVLLIDFNEESNKSILKIVIVNFIIVLSLNLVFEFSFLYVLIYSIILFVILKNKFNEVKKDYSTLLKETKKLSNGNFDIETQVNVGMLNPLRDELCNIKDGFEKAVKEEVKSQRMKTELISNVSHDLKTPLTSIITYVDLLKKNDITDVERMEYVNTIDRNSLRLKNLIDDLFEVSKVTSGNVKLNLIEVNIVSLLQQAVFECSDSLNSAGLELKTNYVEDKIVCQLDSSKTYRIFENLIVNIYKYAMPNTRVYIDVNDCEEDIEITFKNISANEINFSEVEIVERFVQGDTSRNTRGSGLGLAIAKSFTELQNGSFTIETDGDLFKAIVKFKK